MSAAGSRGRNNDNPGASGHGNKGIDDHHDVESGSPGRGFSGSDNSPKPLFKLPPLQFIDSKHLEDHKLQVWHQAHAPLLMQAWLMCSVNPVTDRSLYWGGLNLAAEALACCVHCAPRLSAQGITCVHSISSAPSQQWGMAHSTMDTAADQITCMAIIHGNGVT